MPLNVNREYYEKPQSCQNNWTQLKPLFPRLFRFRRDSGVDGRFKSRRGHCL